MHVMRALGSSVVLVCFGAVGVGCGEEPEPVLETLGSVGQPIQGGYVDATDTQSVGVVHLDANYGIGSCSGTLIAPNVVLSAHHCVAPSSSGGSVSCGDTQFFAPYPPNEFHITTKTNFTYELSDYHNVREVHVPPAGNDFCGNDVSLLILTEPIAATEAVPATPRVDEALVPGEEYYAVGYGATSEGGDGGTRYRRDQLFTQCIGHGCGIGAGIAPSEYLGDTGICQGDSGGGAFDLKNRVHGAASRGAQGCEFPVYAGIFDWGQWIKDVTVYASGLAGLQPPPWSTGYPTDPAYSTPVGQECAQPTDCPSNACLNGYCTRPCNDAAFCPDGYTCNASQLCEEIPPPPVNEDEDETVSSCPAASAPAQWRRAAATTPAPGARGR